MGLWKVATSSDSVAQLATPVQVRITVDNLLPPPPDPETHDWQRLMGERRVYKPLIFVHLIRRKRERFTSSTVNPLRLIYLFFFSPPRLPTYFRILQNMLPPERLAFYLCSARGDALPKLLATPSARSLFCEKHKLGSKHLLLNASLAVCHPKKIVWKTL